MKEKNKPNPTPSELEILQFIWKNGPSTVKMIHEELAKHRDVVYTTTLKTMQVMCERGMLTREAKGRKHIYHAAIEEDATQDQLLDRFLDKTFSGSSMRLVMKALGNYKTSKKDLEELKKYIDDIEKNNPDANH